ncbi:MAG TPA: hypothetical protein VLN56_01190 [Gammaproteobacteria bacterium]|nr:hypothetical protein [Gammaproteobacteria bacterium]
MKFHRGNERPISDVPPVIVLVLLLAFTAQTAWHYTRPEPVASASELPAPPPFDFMRLASLGDPVALSGITMLWLQSFDNQPGISIPFNQLDYTRLIGWLDLILKLNGKMMYPLLAASRLYGEVPDDAKKRQMLEFVYRKFLDDPDRRWPALAHAVFVAKHRLKDLPLALRYASALSEKTTPSAVPFWARQMDIYVLEDMGELESAKVLVGGLLESGTIKDPQELEFLQQRLETLEKQLEEKRQSEKSN